MDFLSKVKDALFGGSRANVTLVAPDSAVRGQPFAVHVTVIVKSAAIDIKSVVVEATCEEVVDANRVKAQGSWTSDENHGEVLSDVRTTVAMHQVVLVGAMSLAAGSTSFFEGPIVLPTSAPTSTRGHLAEFCWTIRARVDMKGRDPRSPWRTLQVAA